MAKELGAVAKRVGVGQMCQNDLNWRLVVIIISVLAHPVIMWRFWQSLSEPRRDFQGVTEASRKHKTALPVSM